MEGDFLQRLRRKYATYGDLLELTIPGNVFSFRKVDEVRKEIEESLRKLASSVISQYWKTKGRKRYELDSRAKKFHVLERHVQSVQELETEMEELKDLKSS